MAKARQRNIPLKSDKKQPSVIASQDIPRCHPPTIAQNPNECSSISCKTMPAARLRSFPGRSGSLERKHPGSSRNICWLRCCRKGCGPVEFLGHVRTVERCSTCLIISAHLITLVGLSVWSMLEGVRRAGRQQFALLVVLGVLTPRYEAVCD